MTDIVRVEYIEILERYLLHCWIICLIPIVISVIIIILEVKRKTFNKDSLILPLIIVAFIGIGLWHTIDVHLDISNESIVTLHFNNSSYYTDMTDISGEWLYFAQTVNIFTDSGEVVGLICRDDIFPFDAQKGTIIYAEHTSMILEYIPDNK